MPSSVATGHFEIGLRLCSAMSMCLCAECFGALGSALYLYRRVEPAVVPIIRCCVRVGLHSKSKDVTHKDHRCLPVYDKAVPTEGSPHHQPFVLTIVQHQGTPTLEGYRACHIYFFKSPNVPYPPSLTPYHTNLDT